MCQCIFSVRQYIAILILFNAVISTTINFRLKVATDVNLQPEAGMGLVVPICSLGPPQLPGNSEKVKLFPVFQQATPNRYVFCGGGVTPGIRNLNPR